MNTITTVVKEGNESGRRMRASDASPPNEGSQWNHWMGNFNSLFSGNSGHSSAANESSRVVTSARSNGSFAETSIISPDDSLKFNTTQMTILAPAQLTTSSRFDDDETRWLHEDQDAIAGTNGKWSMYKGLMYSSLSSLFFSLCAVIVKHLKGIHPGELAAFRFLGILVFSIPLVYSHGYELMGPPNMRHYLIMRGITGATSLFLRFLAFRYLPIADASVIIFSVPVFVSIFACLFLEEPCGAFQIVIVTLTMVGLGLTTRLPTLFGSSLHQQVSNVTNSSVLDSSESLKWTPEHVVGLTAAITSTIFGACVYIVIKKAKTVHYSVIMFNFGWVALIETLILTFIMDGYSIPSSFSEWTYIVLLGVMSFMGQVLLTRSLQLESAGVVVVVRAATDIALAFIWQLLFFGHKPDIWSISGALIVTTCVILTGCRKWLMSLPDHDDTKIRLSKYVK